MNKAIERMSSAEFRRRFGGSHEIMEATPQKAQIRIPKLRQPNKTEAEWIRIQKSRWPGCTVLYEPFSLKLPSGTSYKPDVVIVSDTSGCIMEVWEVKGAFLGRSRDSLRAWKESKAFFKFWEFRFAQKTKDGWKEA
jgi:hypothetical protein